MKYYVEAAEAECLLGGCSYSFLGPTSCSPGGSNCAFALFRDATQTSEDFDQPIKKLTQKMNFLMREVAEGPKPAGKQLAILWTPGGPMLRWVKHVHPVTAASGLEANEQAFDMVPFAEMEIEDPDAVQGTD